MAQYIKNDINFHGARSKTRAVVEKNNPKKQGTDSRNANIADGWGAPRSSGGASSCDKGLWDDSPTDPVVSDVAWGQEKLVTGKSTRNQKFRSGRGNKTFTVPIQQLPNWDEVDAEFPALGGSKAPVVNVWEKRKEKFEEIKAIEPSNQTEEERMIQEAIELSKKEAKKEEEKRRELEEEYKLQMKLLEGNPELFEEFRPASNTADEYANDFMTQSKEQQIGYDGYEQYPEDEPLCENDGTWGKNEETSRKKSSELPKDFPPLKQNFASSVTKTAEVTSNTGTKPKISKVINMFGGWGSDSSKSVNWSSTTDVKDTISGSTVVNPVPKSEKYPKTSKRVSAQEKNSKVFGSIKTNLERNNISVSAKNKVWNVLSFDEEANPDVCDNVELNSKTDKWGYSTNEEKNFVSRSTNQQQNSKAVGNFNTNPENWNEISVKNKKKDCANFEEENKSDPYSDNVELSFQSNEYEYSPNNSELSQNVVLNKASENCAEIKEKEIFSFDSKNCSDSYRSAESGYSLLNSIVPDYVDLAVKCADSPQLQEESNISSSIEAQLCNKDTVSLAQYNTKSLNQHGISKVFSENALSSGLSELDHLFLEPKLAKNGISDSLSNLLPEDSINNDFMNKNSLIPPHGDDAISPPTPYFMDKTSKDSSSLPLFNGFQNNGNSSDLSLNNDGLSPIDPPKPAPLSSALPESMNVPQFLPQPNPLMAAFMNPSLMMGMNPMMMQQMLMLNNPFFLKQLQQMDMYYKSLGMPMLTGMPLFPQPMPVPTYYNLPNVAFSDPMYNLMDSGKTSSGIPMPRTNAEALSVDPPIPPLSRRPDSERGTAPSQPPGIDVSLLMPEVTSDADTNEDDFWYKDYLSVGDSLPLIPPPKATQAPAQDDAPANQVQGPQLSEESKINRSTVVFPSRNQPSLPPFNCVSVKTPMCLVDSALDNSSQPKIGMTESSNRTQSKNVPSETDCLGWGNLEDVYPKSNKVSSAWDDSVDGWENESTSSKSMRNSSRYVPEKKPANRQPASQPYLGRHKT